MTKPCPVEVAVKAFCAALVADQVEPAHLHAAVEGRDGLAHLSAVEHALAVHWRSALAKELVWLSRSTAGDHATLRLRAVAADGGSLQDVSVVLPA